ncbi:MAG: heparin lyase I family protein [Bacteroidota bacterium]
MKKFSVIVFSLLIVVCFSCNKKKFFDGPNFFSEDFESVTSADSLFQPDNILWSYSQVTVAGNYFEIDSTNVHTGNHSMKFFAKKSSDKTVSKCSISKQFMAFWKGDVVKMSGWYFIEGTARVNYLFLFDIEEQAAIGAGPGMRLAISGDSGSILVNHKFLNPSIYQTVGEEISFPRNQWVHLEMEIKLSQRKKGYVKVWQNSQLILERQNWKTLPSDELYGLQGTKGMYGSIEFGITANASDNDLTLYLDDIEVKKIN